MGTRQPSYETWNQFDDDLDKGNKDSWANDLVHRESSSPAPRGLITISAQMPTARQQATGSPHNNTNNSQSTDPWRPTSEQRAYYLSQFLRLQPDPRAKLGGSLAKAFFDLSKLQNTELSHIWQLADADTDGELTLGEFIVAMHLVVLRRNGLPVPRFLPPTLAQMRISQSVFTGPPFDPSAADELPGTSAQLPPPTVRQRRWSISSQNDISSLAEGNVRFDAKPNSNTRLQHPVPLKARTLPLASTESPTLPDSNFFSPSSPRAISPSPPTPPPRARLPGLEPVTIDTFSSDRCFAVLNRSSPSKLPIHAAPSIEDKRDGGDGDDPSTDSAPRLDVEPAVARLRSECDSVVRANGRLSVELMELQQQRICLELLLDRLLPLKAASTAPAVSNS